MGLFNNLNTDGVERSEDQLGGSFSLLDSNIYTATIKAAYAGRSSAGAMNITLICNINNTEYTETVYITNRNGEPFFVDKNSQKKKFLPGYNIINSICMLCANKSIKDMDTEEKTLNIYDREAGKNVPKAVPVLTALSGQIISLGIIKEIRNKVKLENGEYVTVADTREENHIVAVFDPNTKQTLNERQDGKEADFYDKWLAKNQGITVDKRTVKDAPASKSGAATSTESPRKSLFG